MIMKKLISGILLSLVMVLIAGVSSMAYAVDYNLWVGGTQVTDANAADIRSDDANQKGTASYDPGTNTLTLTNYSYNGKGYMYDHGEHGESLYAAIYANNQNLNILLIDSNSITNNAEAGNNDYSGVYVSQANLSVEGNGSLNVSIANHSTGLRCTNGKMSIKDGNVNVFCENNGIFVYGKDLEITGGTVTATSNRTGILT